MSMNFLNALKPGCNLEVKGRSFASILVSATSAGREGECPEMSLSNVLSPRYIQTSQTKILLEICVELDMLIRKRRLKGMSTCIAVHLYCRNDLGMKKQKKP